MTPDEYADIVLKKIDDLFATLTLDHNAYNTGAALKKLDLIVRAVKLIKKKYQVEEQLEDLRFAECDEEYDWEEPETDPSGTAVQAA